VALHLRHCRAGSVRPSGRRQNDDVHHEAHDVAPGLWIWRVEYPDWHAGAGWEPMVTSVCVE